MQMTQKTTGKEGGNNNGKKEGGNNNGKRMRKRYGRETDTRGASKKQETRRERFEKNKKH